MTSSWNPNGITSQQYADEIQKEISKDSESYPDFAGCKSWDDLHDLCDVNDYYESVDMTLNVSMPSINDDGEDAWEDYMQLLNDASDIVEKWLPTRQEVTQ